LKATMNSSSPKLLSSTEESHDTPSGTITIGVAPAFLRYGIYVPFLLTGASLTTDLLNDGASSRRTCAVLSMLSNLSTLGIAGLSVASPELRGKATITAAATSTIGTLLSLVSVSKWESMEQEETQKYVGMAQLLSLASWFLLMQYFVHQGKTGVPAVVSRGL
jgi:hypothetical protein